MENILKALDAQLKVMYDRIENLEKDNAFFREMALNALSGKAKTGVLEEMLDGRGVVNGEQDPLEETA